MPSPILVLPETALLWRVYQAVEKGRREGRLDQDYVSLDRSLTVLIELFKALELIDTPPATVNYRQQAAEARAAAERMADQDDSRAMLEVALMWEGIAGAAERSG